MLAPWNSIIARKMDAEYAAKVTYLVSVWHRLDPWDNGYRFYSMTLLGGGDQKVMKASPSSTELRAIIEN